jgi:SAM-dependent methyltransferase
MKGAPSTVAFEALKRRTACRICGGAELVRFLSLGEVPLANSFLRADQLDSPEPRFPLEVFFCTECSLVQLLHVVNPEILFSNYLYRTGTNQTIGRHNAALAEQVVDSLRLASNGLVVEIGSNDGSLLQCFRQRGLRTLGVEPAKNIARLARNNGIETVEEFFDAETAARLPREYGAASVVIANNVLAHVDETVEFLRACRRILHADGRLIIEVPYLREMLESLEYDTIYHEHLCYFSVTSLMPLFSKAGLELERVDRTEIHGGSLRLWARHATGGGHADSVLRLAEEECAAGLTDLARFQAFARSIGLHRKKLLHLLHQLKREGKSIVGYGAPAKGNTLLCYCGIGAGLLPYTVDRSPLKIGLFTPGTHIPVVPVERIIREQPDYVLILAWNFAPEIMDFLRPYQQRGGRFILPIPEARVIGR